MTERKRKRSPQPLNTPSAEPEDRDLPEASRAGEPAGERKFESDVEREDDGVEAAEAVGDWDSAHDLRRWRPRPTSKNWRALAAPLSDASSDSDRSSSDEDSTPPRPAGREPADNADAAPSTHNLGFRRAAAKVREFPQQPGVYLMKDSAGRRSTSARPRTRGTARPATS